MKSEKYSISGMSCAACSASVEKVVGRLDGVSKAEVSLLSNSMTCEYDEKRVTPDAIIAAIEKAGFTASAVTAEPGVKRVEPEKPQSDSIRTRLIASVCFLAALMYVSMGHMLGLPFTHTLSLHENAVAFGFTQFLLTLPVLYLNRGFFIKGFKALFRRVPNMDTLVAVGSSAAVVYGVFSIYMMAYGSSRGDGALVHEYMSNLYFESAAMILTLVSVGKYLESRAKKKTDSSLKKLIELAPDKATVLRDGREEIIDVSSVAVGDTVILKPGERVPVDAVIIHGASALDQSALTGESIPVDKTVGDAVMAGSINVNGYLRVSASKVGSDTTLAGIISLVENAAASKAPAARLADKVSGIFVPIVMGIALVCAAVWLIAGKDAGFALSRAISVLVVSCPCALGLATPVAVTVGMGKSASMGILIKSAEALENIHKVDTVVFDKTGTITTGKPSVSDVMAVSGREEFIKLAASLEAQSEHPLSKAVTEYYSGGLYSVENFSASAGRGVSATFNGKRLSAGNLRYMGELGVDTAAAGGFVSEQSQKGSTLLYFELDGSLLGVIAVSDSVRETSAEAVKRLKNDGCATVMLTGDSEAAAKSIASDVGVDEVISEVLPADKEAEIQKIRKSSKFVAMVGDGINDSPALSAADVGIAVGNGSDIAIESADIILIKNDLRGVAQAVEFSRRVVRNIKQNLFWAFFYNTLGIPVAAGLLYPYFEITLSPMLAAAAMSLSSLFVVTNALRLYNKKMGAKT